MALQQTEIIDLYRTRARRYDFTAQLYYLIGFREQAYRKRAVAALGLKQGDHIVEIGCGTGLNFSLLQNAVGPEGRITGVDLTDAMLASAKERVRRNDWTNVELVQANAARYQFSPGINGIFSTFALTLVAEYDEVIRAGAAALAPGGRFVVLDFKLPSTWLARFAPLLVAATRPFGVSFDLADRHLWESMQRHLGNVELDEVYGGFAYVAASEKPASRNPAAFVDRCSLAKNPPNA
jgi:demethylmenaquinone methyltransferase/2-methoxy-6-polyprenyl-1,4-benzoquinol methylase